MTDFEDALHPSGSPPSLCPDGGDDVATLETAGEKVWEMPGDTFEMADPPGSPPCLSVTGQDSGDDVAQLQTVGEEDWGEGSGRPGWDGSGQSEVSSSAMWEHSRGRSVASSLASSPIPSIYAFFAYPFCAFFALLPPPLPLEPLGQIHEDVGLLHSFAGCLQVCLHPGMTV